MEIAQALGSRINGPGCRASVLEPQAVTNLAGVDAVVIGSAVYAGHWLGPAQQLVERLADELRARPVWLFSSGPVGDPPVPRDDAVDVDAMIAATEARDHRLFAGRIDKSSLGFGERALVRALRVPEGDFRDWDAISDWADEIAATLTSEASAPR